MLLHQLEGHEAGVTGVAFSPDRIRLASSSADGTVIFWDAGTGEPLGDPLKIRVRVITSLAFSPSDGATLALGADDGSVYLWDVVNDQQKAEFLGAQGGRVVSLAFSPTDPGLLASGGGDAVILWDVGQKADRLVHPFGPFVLQDNFVSSVAFSPDGRLLAMGAYGAVQLRSVEDGSELWTTTYQTDLDQNGSVYLAFSPADPNTLITASEDGQVYLRQVDQGGVVSNEHSQFSVSVGAIAVSGDGRVVAVASQGDVLRMWQAEAGAPVLRLRYPAGVLALSPDGQWLATGAGTEVKLWSAESGGPVWGQNQHGGDVLSLAFSPDGSTLASGSTEDWIYLWDVASGESQGVLQENASDILSLAFSADGTLLAAGTEEGGVWLWNLGDGTVNGVLTEADTASPLRDVTFSPDGGQVLAVSDDGLLHQWRVTDGASLGPLPFLWDGVPVAPFRTAFSPDGALIAGGLFTGEVLVWQLGPELTLEAPLVGHTAKVEGLAFASNGLLLVSGSADGTVRLWGVRP
jgi:WD40 repeat protein